MSGEPWEWHPDGPEAQAMLEAALAEEEVERVCILFHDAYEAAALGAGWETQERSRKPWADVPEANQQTMRATIRAVLASDWFAAIRAEVGAKAWAEGFLYREKHGLLAPLIAGNPYRAAQPTKGES